MNKLSRQYSFNLIRKVGKRPALTRGAANQLVVFVLRKNFSRTEREVCLNAFLPMISIRGRRVHMFIDNAVALSAVIHGYAKSTDMAYMSNAFHMQLAGMRASVFLDYVPSKANIADLPYLREVSFVC